jgi:Domain of unknown function (DUF4333)
MNTSGPSSAASTAGSRRNRLATLARSSLAPPLLLASFAVALSACGGDDGGDKRSGDGAPSGEQTLATGKVESAVKETVTSSLSQAPPTSLLGGADVDEKVRVRSVECPATVPIRKGQKFKCALDADPYSGHVDIQQLDGDGRALSINARLKATVKGVSTRRELSTTITLGQL